MKIAAIALIAGVSALRLRMDEVEKTGDAKPITEPLAGEIIPPEADPDAVAADENLDDLDVGEEIDPVTGEPLPPLPEGKGWGWGGYYNNFYYRPFRRSYYYSNYWPRRYSYYW